MRIHDTKQTYAAGAALALLAVIPFLNSLSGPWIFDDLPLILRNPLVHGLDRLPEIWTSDYWRSTGAPSQLYRPLTLTSYALTWVAAGQNTLPYHATNMLLHAACTLLLWSLLLRARVTLGALLAAGIFAVHPIHVEAVANIVGRSELLAACFFLLALYAHQRAAISRLWGLPGFLAMCATLFSKETGAFLLLYIPLSDLWVSRRSQSPMIWRRQLLAWLPLLAAIVLYGILRVASVGWGAGLVADVGWADHLRLSSTAALKNLQMLVAPVQSRAVWRHSDMPGLAYAVMGATTMAVLLVLTILAFRRRWAVAPPLIMLVLSLVPLLHVRPNVIWVWERGLYAPSLAGAWLLCLGVEAAATARVYRVLVAALLLLSIGFLFKTAWLSNLYSDSLRFWEYQYGIDRHSNIALNYSQVLLDRKRTVDAIAVREEALSGAPRDPMLISALASTYLQAGNGVRANALLTSASQEQLSFTDPRQRKSALQMLEKLARAAGAESAARAFATQRAR